jgi:hypothetical protein
MAGRNRRLSRQNSNVAVDSFVEGNSSTSIKVNYNDFEEMIRKFSGDETMSVKKWIEEFEMYAITFNWNDLQKYIYCKRSLNGAAKIFVECESKPLTYKDLKIALINEFQSKVNSADIHKKLQKRKMRPDETFREYLYQMIGIASQAEIDEPSIIDYVIKGIKDHPNNKMILHGSSSIKDFKSKLEIYEKAKSEYSERSDNNHVKSSTPVDRSNFEKKQRFCFNCGSKNHEFYSCPERNRGPKCFNCNEFGHKKSECPKARMSGTSSNFAVKSGMFTPCKINNIFLDGLIDTGSDICILKEHYFELIKPKYFDKQAKTTVAGLGANATTAGLIKVDIEVNGEIFSNVEVHLLNNSLCNQILSSVCHY